MEAAGEGACGGDTATEAAGGAGRLVSSTQAEDRRMIALVRARPLLYTRSSLPVASYYSKVKGLWLEVADDMGWSVSEVRRKWSHIRNSYSRHLRNELHGVRTGRGRAVSRWYLADQLEFLRDHMATDARVPSSLVPDPWHAALAADAWLAAPAPEPAAPPRRDDDDDDCYFHFFRGLHADYRELPPDKQRLFRRKCLLLLHELMDGAGGEEGAGGEGGAGEVEGGAGCFAQVKLESPDYDDS